MLPVIVVKEVRKATQYFFFSRQEPQRGLAVVTTRKSSVDVYVKLFIHKYFRSRVSLKSHNSS